MRNKRPKSKFKMLLMIVFVVTLVMLGVMALGLSMQWWSFGNNVIKIDTKTLADTKETEFVIGYGKHNNLVCVGELVVFDNDGYLEWRNQKGEVVYKNDTKMDSPLIRANHDYLVVAESNGNRFEVYNNQRLVWRGVVGGSILNVDINENGYVSVIRKYTGYKSAIEVFDKIGNKLFYALRASNMIINAIVLSDNKTTLLNSINSNGCALETVVEYLDGQGKSINKFVLDNTILLKILSLEDGGSVLSSSNQVFFVDSSGKRKTQRKFDYVQSIAALNANTVAVAGISSEKAENSAHVVQFINDNNEGENTLDFGSSIKSMIAQNDVVAVNLGRKVMVVNRHGRVLGGTTLGSEVLNIHFLSNNRILLTTSENAVICKY